ncbi:hypothetical protein [Nostoc sp. DedSLP04]|uniref:hypothetical protein n=1 Tax=Nostoc sp. DedSLP04 TaxID=3075401 RepID=UPI002AD38182|nr:hypothetical protein [Nostoc sp. DedSLP04]MDZ8032767.1 hypothetical protein [Nostoc sp. DedSLP04]
MSECNCEVSDVYDGLRLPELSVNNNPQLKSPPPEIIEQGTQGILNYLRARLEAKE